MAALLLALLSCDASVPADDHVSRGFNRPDVALGVVQLTTSYDRGQPVRAQLGAGEAASEVTLTSSIELNFNRFLLPHKTLRQSICVQAATSGVASIDACSDPFQEFTEPEYNPVARRVTYRLRAGARWSPQTTYTVSVFRAEPTGSGIFAFDDAPLQETVSFQFTTRAESADDTERALYEIEELGPTPARYCETIDCFANCNGDSSCEAGCRSTCVEPSCASNGDLMAGNALLSGCAFSNCHGTAGDDSVLAMNLDLFDAAGLAATAIGRTAHQSQQGETSTQADTSPLRFGRAMPIIDPCNPGNSYLIYKLATNPLNHPRDDSGALIDELPNEIGRLRDSVVSGLPMPAEASGSPTGLAAGDAVGLDSYRRMLLINAWIASGAVLDCSAPLPSCGDAN